MLKLKFKHILSTLIILIVHSFSLSQNTIVSGIILNELNEPIENVSIQTSANGTISNLNGFYKLIVASNTEISLKFSHINYKPISLKINLQKGDVYELNPVLKTETEQIEMVVITSTNRNALEGVTTISPQIIRSIKGAQPGVENLLKTLPGVNISNELSNQYSVRGGNFDENLVYVNDIEVYRPFLVRSGQQEGLSFVNSDMIQNLKFSSGGFQAKYGDKLSSVLDIVYRKPKTFTTRVDLNLLGGSFTSEGISKDEKFSALVGLRYRDNSLLVDARETQTLYDPKFFDTQAYLNYSISEKLSIGFLGNITTNNYNYRPQTRKTNFGTIDNPMALLIFYEGQERDKYSTYFGATNFNYKINDSLILKFISSLFHTTEQEYYDILAQYRLGEVNSSIGDTNLGNVEFSEGIGSQLTHARNDLDAIITNYEIRGDYKKNNNHFQWSAKFTNEDIIDRLVEWEVIDSAGFSINPPDFNIVNNEPYSSYTGPLATYKNIRSSNNTKLSRTQAFLQWSKRDILKSHEFYYNLGIRAHHWKIEGPQIEKSQQIVFSPRAQFTFKPKGPRNLLFRLGAGLYYQPPFYRELRDFEGSINSKLKAQKSAHFVAGAEHNFKLWNRPFKLISEVYYKKINDVNPYTVENVRIRYNANNDAEAYAYGLDLRLNGEFVPGYESWFSFGYMKTEESISGKKYIPRPMDQRLKFAILFQDYIPNIPNMRMYLNLVYNTGVPGGSPSYADVYDYQNRLPDYKRADIGMSYDLVIPNKSISKSKWKNNFDEFTIGLEIFNVFDSQNSITNTWVRDVYSKLQYSIPNYLTPRVFNLRLAMKF
tara:strand:- start:90802 stop:93276 length:2475 start_codon:yes stop_codon:yes gene_type:complete